MYVFIEEIFKDERSNIETSLSNYKIYFNEFMDGITPSGRDYRWISILMSLWNGEFFDTIISYILIRDIT
jgi:hypothetical protein